MTLIWEAPDYRTYGVYPAKMLAAMAALAWRVRFKNRERHTKSGRPQQAGQSGTGRARVLLSGRKRSREA